MDSLAISPEELAAVTGTAAPPPVVKPQKAAPSIGMDLPGLSAITDSHPAPPLTGSRMMDAPPARPTASARQDVTARPVKFAPLNGLDEPASTTNLDLLLGVTLQVTVELGRTKMNIEEILRLGPGSVVELEKLAGEPVDVLVNDKMIARGEVVVLDDRFGVRITDVLLPAQRLNSLR